MTKGWLSPIKSDSMGSLLRCLRRWTHNWLMSAIRFLDFPWQSNYILLEAAREQLWARTTQEWQTLNHSRIQKATWTLSSINKIKRTYSECAPLFFSTLHASSQCLTELPMMINNSMYWLLYLCTANIWDSILSEILTMNALSLKWSLSRPATSWLKILKGI